MSTVAVSSPRVSPSTTVFPILFALSFCHLLNDTMQALLPAIYPVLKTTFNLTFTEIGLITFANQFTASLLQPFVGIFTDKKPLPFLLVAGMASTFTGLILIAKAPSLLWVIAASVLVGVGSAVFHPESSRIVRLAAGQRYGTAQAIFQVGGNSGASLGPLLAALVVVPYGRSTLLGLACMALAGMAVLGRVGTWFNANRPRPESAQRLKGEAPVAVSPVSPRRVWLTIAVLLTLVFSKYLYLATMTNYFTFFLQKKFHVSTESADLYLFAFLLSVAVGTFLGGPLGDHFGRKPIIWISILGVAPFSLLLPFANLFWAGVLASITGVILASAFSAIVVYAQELMPGNVGLVAGLFFGFAFGMGAVCSAVLGKVADLVSLDFVFQIACCSPLIGLLAWYLPDLSPKKKIL